MVGNIGLVEALRNSTRFFSLLLNRHHADAAGLYALMAKEGVLSDKTLFINLGYWENTCEYDEACYALANVLAETAGMGKDDVVLDAGFGFAEQCIFWARTFGPASIVGLNISEFQVEVAKQRVQEAGFADRIRLINGTATDMPISDNSVTKVVALESAFHFETRERFFEEAFRVLEPGGRIALADLLFLPPQKSARLYKRLLAHLGRTAWQIPGGQNLDSIESYTEKLQAAGFINIRIRSIRHQVLLPFRTYLRERSRTASAAGQPSLSMKFLWWAASRGVKLKGVLDYVLVSANRP